MDQEAKQQIIARLQQANNVLVTVSANPSVDQLSACIGMTLLLNKMGKHATAVFSGAIPSTIEFLKPEETIEKNTDSLRDFIIALDKSKADKLRYKVEDKVVKIFITPYRTSLGQKDLEFSQGDFNVDAVVALGVHERTDLDKAITDHGRILHDATVISVNNKDQGNLGSINWINVGASSLSEMLVDLVHGLTTDPMDAQMATAFMTGIVAETARFSNEKTSPAAMSMASELMAAGANQQLIASKLETKPAADAPTKPKAETEVEVNEEDGSLRISHPSTEELPKAAATPEKPVDLPAVVDEAPPQDDEPTPAPSEPAPEPPQPPVLDGPKISKIRDDELPANPSLEEPKATGTTGGTSMVLQPPSMGGRLTANSQPEQLEPSTDPLSGNAYANRPILSRTPLASNSAAPSVDKPDDTATLASIEESVGSPHVAAATEPEVPEPAPEPPVEPEKPAEEPIEETPTASEEQEEDLEEAREAVDDAIAEGGNQPLEPVQALGAQPIDLNLHDAPVSNVDRPIAADTSTMTDTPAPAEFSQPISTPPIIAPSEPAPAVPYFPPSAATPMMSPAPEPAPAPAPMPQPAGFGNLGPAPVAPTMPSFMDNAPVGQGIAPDIPPQLMPTTPPIDTTAAAAAPAPPPVPPPMMPPATPSQSSFNSPL